MLLAPLALPERSARKTAVTAMPLTARSPMPPSIRGAPAAPAYALALYAWLALGACTLLCVPAARGGPLLGATLPFWLVGAPVLDLLWVNRAGLRERLRQLRAARRSAAPAAVRVPRRRVQRTS